MARFSSVQQDEFALIAAIVFGAMGLWLGVDGFDIWYQGEYGDSQYGALSLLVMSGGLGVFLNNYVAAFGEKSTTSRQISHIGRVMFFTGTCMTYGYVAGPFHPAGEVLNPWLIFPMAGTIPLLPVALDWLNPAANQELEPQKESS